MARWRRMQLGKTGTAAVSTVLALLLAAKPGLAGTIVIDSMDDAGEGFNDPTTAEPIGQNTATTRGTQALAAFNRAASIWSGALRPSVDIHVAARFAPLECTVLGKGEPSQYTMNVPGGVAGTWYPLALANHLANADLGSGDPPITLTFNGALGTANCPQTGGWYFGFDSQSGDLTDLVTAVLHELGHGLGMITPIDLTSGNFLQGAPDIFSTMIVDNRTGKRWSDMSAGERATSARDFHQLLWDGAQVTAAATAQLKPGMPELALGGASLGDLDPAIAVATKFGAALTNTPVEGGLSTVSPGNDACGTIDDLTGKVAFIEAGGGCSDVAKALAVQGKGAVGAILVNSQTGFEPVEPAPATGDDTTKVTIPVVAINQADASSIRTALVASVTGDAGAGFTAKLWTNPGRAIGTSKTGRVYLNATDPVQPGSSVTHWDPIIQPALLMQPGYAQHDHELDLTLPLMQDIGWTDVGTRDGGRGTTGGIVDSGISDAGDAAADAFVPNLNPPGPNRYVDAGHPPPEGGSGIDGITWAKKPTGCQCKVQTGASEPRAGFAAVLVGLAALLRRRGVKKRAG